MLEISAPRLLADLDRLAAIGGRSDGGVDRVAGSAADWEARRWLATRIEQAGLEAEIDQVGNVLGRVPGSRGPWLLLGSHTDTVPAGGRLDGALGVVAALEVLRALRGANDRRAERLQMVSFFDEEGISGTGLAGSRALAERAGDRLLGYLELHVEQGPRLERQGAELGVVSAIVAIRRLDVLIEGQANHAGTTPMSERRDAGRAAFRTLAGLRELLHQADPEMVGNVGQLELRPGSPNVVPGQAAFTLELRAAEEAALERAQALFRQRLECVCAEERCDPRIAARPGLPATPMDPRVVAALERVCRRLGRPWLRLASGAGHDAVSLAPRCPVGMLFVPSTGGISHSPAEHTPEPLLALGAQALLEGALETLAALDPVGWLNAAPEAETTALLLRCCAARRWAERVAADRPYADAESLLAAAEAAWWRLGPDDWKEAISAHPRIGEASGAREREEQAGVEGASPAILARLAESNRRYEQRFGWRFLICASGRSADEMLAALEQRLGNDPERELQVAAGEQAQITRQRLARWLQEGA
jgi:N-carbamoyl-L-amino-acid hydrolase